ncbi:hypothetical protein G5I_02424 [Acromyrmex echinatior]|uniref:Uncharacterized protein n=1 Tax=Acromyrmex echinatior TaxID=103372 RepID=F4WA95_ACREC|nr:hypothetical protein G5I_02424 [Acromyrmex echinatior]
MIQSKILFSDWLQSIVRRTSTGSKLIERKAPEERPPIASRANTGSMIEQFGSTRMPRKCGGWHLSMRRSDHSEEGGVIGRARIQTGFPLPRSKSATNIAAGEHRPGIRRGHDATLRASPFLIGYGLAR